MNNITELKNYLESQDYKKDTKEYKKIYDSLINMSNYLNWLNKNTKLDIDSMTRELVDLIVTKEPDVHLVVNAVFKWCCVSNKDGFDNAIELFDNKLKAMKVDNA